MSIIFDVYGREVLDSRGNPTVEVEVTLDDGGLVNKIVQRGRVFVPMLVGLFRHASVLACAMEARCYGAPGVRTCLHGEQRVGPRSVALAAAFSAFCIFMGVLL